MRISANQAVVGAVCQSDVRVQKPGVGTCQIMRQTGARMFDQSSLERVTCNEPTPPAKLTLTKLRQMTDAQQMAAFARGTCPESIEAFMHWIETPAGQPLHLRGSALSFKGMNNPKSLFGRFWRWGTGTGFAKTFWAGKSLQIEGDKITGFNRMLGWRHLFKFDVVIQDSLVDGKPCVVLKSRRFPFSMIYDEMRIVDGALVGFVAPMFAKTKRLMNWALERPAPGENHGHKPPDFAGIFKVS